MTTKLTKFCDCCGNDITLSLKPTIHYEEVWPNGAGQTYDFCNQQCMIKRLVLPWAAPVYTTEQRLSPQIWFDEHGQMIAAKL